MLRLPLSFFWWFAAFIRSRHEVALERRLAPAIDRAQAQEPAPKIESMGSAVLGCAATILVKMGGGADRGKTGDSGELAFSRISALLALPFSPTPGSAKNYFRPSWAYSSHGQPKSPLGRAQD